MFSVQVEWHKRWLKLLNNPPQMENAELIQNMHVVKGRKAESLA